MTDQFAPVACSLRGSWTENLHFGVAAIATPEGYLVAGLGEPSRRVFLRSAAKPVQVLPLLCAGGRQAYALEPEEIALICSSHAGTAEHVAKVLELLSRNGLREEDLACGPHPPLSVPSAEELRESGLSPRRAHNNCSANHIGQLLACRLLELPLDGYHQPTHPLQERVLELIGGLAGIAPREIQIGVDGCGLPSFRLPLAHAARLYACLADPVAGRAGAEIAVEVGTALDAMASHPEMVAGPGRFTTELIRATGGRVIGKEGAEGFYGAAVRGPVALGVAIKIVDGTEGCRDAVVLEVLRQAGCLSHMEFEQLAPFQRTELRNHSGDLTGELFADLELAELDVEISSLEPFEQAAH